MTSALASLAWTSLLLIGLPAGLIRLVGWPLPRHVPTSAEWAAWIQQPLTRASIIDTAAILVWLMWAALLATVLATAYGRIAHLCRHLPDLRLPGPLQGLSAAMLGTVAVSTSVSAVTMPAAHAAVATDTAPHPQPANLGPRQAAPAIEAPGESAGASPPVRATLDGSAGVPAGARSAPGHVHHVVPGDTLWDIAQAKLGDPNRWLEICELNWHRHFPTVGGTLRDCDLIYPGWDLTLPADAKPLNGAAPAPPPPPPPAQPEPDPEPGGTRQPTPAPSASARTQDPDGVVEPATTMPSATASASTAPGAAPPSTPTAPSLGATSPPAASASPGTSAPTSDEDTTAAPSTDDDGVHLPGGSFVPWALAAAITAAAAMVWLHRRRRFVPDGEGAEDDPPELPPPVVELHRHVTRNSDLPTPSDLAERAAAVPAQPLLPPGGVGLVGDGAHAAARAALISTLASGGPRDPDRRGEVVIDATTLTTLIGADAAALGPWPRLHVADDLDHALSVLDARLLHRARILDEHSLTDLDSLREHAPDEEALPPVLLICQTPPPGALMRARVSVGLGAGLDVSAVLLGSWEHGTTINVAADGHTRLVGGPPVEAIGDRVAVLDTAEAVAILATLREAHTGRRTTLVLRPPAPPPTAEPEPEAGADHGGADSEPAEPITGEPADTPAGEPRRTVRLRVLGTPRVEDITLPGRSLRGKAAELAVYLACHPHGADTATIAEHLFPEAKVHASKQQVHTNASNLRHVLGRAGEPLPGGYVLKRGASVRYRLDPATVEVDLWRLRDLLTRARLASAPARTEMLREACEAYTAPLAAGYDYEWVEPHRETVRQSATEAHLLLADDLLATDPQAASDLLDKAIGLDGYNEELYRKAMHARHALGDADGIRALLRAITKALSDLDAEPDDATVDLAAKLRTSLETR